MIDPILIDGEQVARIDLSTLKDEHDECEYTIDLDKREARCSCGKGFTIQPHVGILTSEAYTVDDRVYKVKNFINKMHKTRYSNMI